MPSPFIGQIMVFPGNYAPGGWALCDGALLPVADYPELFELIGTTYGGDGHETFALPDLRGRVPLGVGQGRGLPSYSLAQKVGREAVTLTIARLPPHGHTAMAADTPGDSNMPANNAVLSALGGQAAGEYATPAYAPPGTQTALNAVSVGSTGGSRPHNNLQPYLAINFCIARGGTMPA